MKHLCAALLALAAAGSAEARIYGFIDEHGVAHYSNVPGDRRYAFIMESPPAARPRRPARPADAAGLRARREALRGQVAEVARDYRLDAALVHAVITAESGYDPRARSVKGAMGLMQLMPETARRYCVRDPYDPAENLRAGARYLRDLLQRYNHDLSLALAAYNAGEGAVARHGNRVPPFAETREYVPRVLGLYEQYRRSGALRADSPELRTGRGVSGNGGITCPT